MRRSALGTRRHRVPNSCRAENEPDPIFESLSHLVLRAGAEKAMRSLSESALLSMSAKSAKGDVNASMAIAEHHLAVGSRDEAKNYYVIAARQGSSAAAGAVAVLCAEDGADDDAVEWLRIACRAGNKLACTHLSIAYLGGRMGLKPDKKKAAEYGRLGDPSD